MEMIYSMIVYTGTDPDGLGLWDKCPYECRAVLCCMVLTVPNIQTLSFPPQHSSLIGPLLRVQNLPDSYTEPEDRFKQP